MHEPVLLWVVGLSAATMIVGAVIVPVLIVKMPPDYFLHRRRRVRWHHRHPVLRALVWSLRNLLGGLLLAAGVMMLFLPGQGLLSIGVGLSVMDFPGKFRLERRLMAWGPVLKAANWVRARAGKAPIDMRCASVCAESET
jgi:hypothetical protein